MSKQQDLDFRVLTDGKNVRAIGKTRNVGCELTAELTEELKKREDEKPEQYLERIRKTIIEYHPDAEKLRRRVVDEYFR